MSFPVVRRQSRDQGKRHALLRIDLDGLHTDGRSLGEMVREFTEQLRNIKSSLENRDYVSLCDILTYEATLEDPQVFTRPWTIRMLLYRHKEPNFKLLEYECNAYLEDAEKEAR